MIYTIGDIHGELYQLRKLIEDKIKPSPSDINIFLGDYIDRGPQSKEVIDYLLEFEKIYNCVFLKGNHEDMMLFALKNKYHPVYDYDPPLDVWLMNGGRSTLRSYDISAYYKPENIWENEIPEEHKVFYDNLRMYYETDDYYYVHAGLTKNSPEEADPYEILWFRYDYPTQYKLSKNLIYGHTPHKYDIRKEKNKNGALMIDIDTGCGKGGKLTGYCVETGDYKQT